jgi:hypothetical protein
MATEHIFLAMRSPHVYRRAPQVVKAPMFFLFQDEFSQERQIQPLLQVLESVFASPAVPLRPSSAARALVRVGLLKEDCGAFTPDQVTIQRLMPLTQSLKEADRSPFDAAQEILNGASKEEVFARWYCFLLGRAPEAAEKLTTILRAAVPHDFLSSSVVERFLNLLSQSLASGQTSWRLGELDAPDAKFLVDIGLLFKSSKSFKIDSARLKTLLPLAQAKVPPSAITLELMAGYRAEFVKFYWALKSADADLAARLELGIKDSLAKVVADEQNESTKKWQPEVYGSALKALLKKAREQSKWLQEWLGEPSLGRVSPWRITLRLNKDLFTDEVAKLIQSSPEGRILVARKKVYDEIEADREPSDAMMEAARMNREGLRALKAHRLNGLRICPAIVVLHLGKKKIRASVFAAAYKFPVSTGECFVNNQPALEAVASLLRAPASEAGIKCSCVATLSLSVDVPLVAKDLNETVTQIIDAIYQLAGLLDIKSNGYAGRHRTLG